MTHTRLLGALFAMFAGVFLTGAFAQQPPAAAPAAEAAAPLQEVIVTGSRIPVPANITATSPTTVVTSEEVKLQGHTDITDLMNQLARVAALDERFGLDSSLGRLLAALASAP